MHTVSFPKMKLISSKSSKTLPQKLQVQFLDRMSHLLNKGYPLLEALTILTWDERFDGLATEITQQLKGGKPIDVCLQASGFSRNVVSFLYFARMHRNLDEVFHQCSTMIQLENKYVNKFKQVIRYPAFLSVFLVIMLFVIDRTIFPAFLTMFQSQETGSKGLTVAVYITGFLITFVKVAGLLVVIVFIYWKIRKSSISLERQLLMYDKIPLLSDYHKLKTTFLFATHLHSILSTGVSMKEALHIMSNQSHYPLLSHQADIILDHLEQGATLAQAIHQCQMFRPELTTIFHKTSDLTTLTRDLAMLSEMLTDMTKQKLNNALEIIQPVFFIIIAVFILFIYGSIMLPMYQWMNQI
ncbi:competence protein ComGB [Thalassobacillus cyri]|uniref:Competence protein ComGB n=1 Tax=Thalassobacillus cyri TaxID=571932 RepID=A0A1H4GSF2_9BACI|nr:competence type IV pilus assembly protein ComGB [Thalassobacillus cyri]SEB12515.1 competence protein ComGB [Thalassobacillus cyri]